MCFPPSCVHIWFVSCPRLGDYEFILFQLCLSYYLQLNGVFSSCLFGSVSLLLINSLLLVFMRVCPTLSCPALSILKTVILSLSSSRCSSFLPAVCTVTGEAFIWKVTPPQNEKFVFGTQFKIFLMKTGRLVTVPLTAKQWTLSRHRKV